MFDGAELARVPLEDGTIGHAEIRVGDTVAIRSGSIWWISAVVEDVAPEEGMRRLSEPRYADAMREAQETLDRELSGAEHGGASAPITSS